MEPPDSSINAVTSEAKVKMPESPFSSGLSMERDTSMLERATISSGKSPSTLRIKNTSRHLSNLSDGSMWEPSTIKSGKGSSTVRLKKTKSQVPSCVSMKSDESMMEPHDFSNGGGISDASIQMNDGNISKKQLEIVFKEVEQKVISIVKYELKRFKKLLSPDFQACSDRDVEDEDDHTSGKRGVLKLTLHILKIMQQANLADTLECRLTPPCQRKLKLRLKDKCQRINEGIATHGNSSLLYQIYTELYITEGGNGEVNQEHEVRQIEASVRKMETEEIPIKCDDIFKPLPGQEKPIKIVLTKGVAGIGKTVSVQKFILDWAEGKLNQDVVFMFPLPFRELNLMKNKKLSLIDLLCSFFPETQKLHPKHYRRYKIMFIFDGLDECRLPLDFQNNENMGDIAKATTLDVLFTNLIKGNLLPSALIWITSRPAAVSQIPPEGIDRVTEVRGFSDPQKQEYFRKRITDQGLASKVITHIRLSRSLYIMCHIPVFCWIAATVLERMLSEAESGEIPKTLTQMFTHFLIFQIKHNCLKYSGKCEIELQQAKETVLALGKLAFQQLEKGQLIFYEEDLQECGISIRDATVYSGVCTQIFREGTCLHLGKVFSFVHLSIQEFLASLYALLCFINKFNLNVQTKKLSELFNQSTMTGFLKNAVDKALESENGHLDLFLRFLLGLSLDSNQTLLQGIMAQTKSSTQSRKETITYIKEKIKENGSPEKSINLFYGLNELNDQSLVQDVQEYLYRGDNHRLHNVKLSPAQWSAIVFVLLNSKEELDVFDLSKYDPSEECLLRLLPVIQASRKVVLAGCSVTPNTCKKFVSALFSENSSLKELHISKTDLQYSGVELLSAGLKNSHCKLETLRLTCCNLTTNSCETLISALQSAGSSLTELDLSNNNLHHLTIEQLSAGLKSSNCSLQKLSLAGCDLTADSCEKLSSALQSAMSSLKELNLSNNELQDSGLKLLCAGLKSSHCKLETLRLAGCDLTANSCEKVTSALQSANSLLKQLDLSNNDLQDSGARTLAVKLKGSSWRLEIIRLASCNLTMNSCEKLALALQSANTSLKGLDLSYNDLKDSGVKLLCPRQKSSSSKLETLRLKCCNLTSNSCEKLTLALQSTHLVLKELDLSNNTVHDSGVELLSAGLKGSNVTLEILRLALCNLGETSCEYLRSALKMENPLKEVDLSNNDLQDSGVELLSDGLKSSHCKLETLRLSGCMISAEGCSSLDSALRANPSHMKELDLTYNHPGESGVKLLSAQVVDAQSKLETLKVEHAGKNRIKQGPRKYACDLTLDPNTAHTHLTLSEENRKVTCVRKRQPYPDHPDRFDEYEQVLCGKSLTGRCYWEVEWSVSAVLAVTYKGIGRKGGNIDRVFGCNKTSWSLDCSNVSFSVRHNKKTTAIPAPPSNFNRVGVYVDCHAGTLSFYSVSSDSHTFTHLHTFNTTFTEPLYAGFRVWDSDSSVCLCEV